MSILRTKTLETQSALSRNVWKYVIIQIKSQWFIHGIPSKELMHRAARGAFDVCDGQAGNMTIITFSSGNHSGGGYTVAIILWKIRDWMTVRPEAHRLNHPENLCRRILCLFRRYQQRDERGHRDYIAWLTSSPGLCYDEVIKIEKEAWTCLNVHLSM